MRSDVAMQRLEIMAAKAVEDGGLPFDDLDAAKAHIHKFHTVTCEYFYRNYFGPRVLIEGYYALMDNMVWIILCTQSLCRSRFTAI